ncbi:MAG: hydrogenase maturation protease [Verrucomicrobia bacterium]|nr:hydrogenase maturation protease [Verrucomicrobiota bacterium]
MAKEAGIHPPGLAAILVVGYGNELRGDDAVGPGVADSVRDWDLPGVQVLKLHQLTPELSEVVASAEAVIFVDAAFAAENADVQVRSIGPSTETAMSAHASNPSALLALAQALFGRRPPAWLVTIPAVNFALGAPLSATAEQGRGGALNRLRELMGELRAATGRFTVS